MKREVKKRDGNDKGKKRGHNRSGRGNHNIKHVRNKACRLHVEAEMKRKSKTHVHEMMHVNNETEMKRACSTCA